LLSKEGGMNNGKLWFETAKNHLNAAEENFRIGQYLVAFQFAIIDFFTLLDNSVYSVLLMCMICCIILRIIRNGGSV